MGSAGFKQASSLDGSSDPYEYYLLTDAEGATMGEALVQTSGRLTKCGATATPEFIAIRTQTAETTSVTPLPVIRVKENREYETLSTATVAATLIGAKVTLATNATQVTATTSSGVFEISHTDGATTNSTVRGYFRR
jgi:hypothetical protein